MKRRVIILHEWDGQPYFQALDRLVRRETGEPPLYREVWCLRQLAVGLVRKNPVLFLRAWRNLFFFLQSFFLANRVFVLGIAPFDPGLVFWSRMRRRNKIIYHTSWLNWDGSHVPKRTPLLDALVRRHWRRFLEDPRVLVVSILAASREDLLKHYRKDPALVKVIPHAVDRTVFHPPSDWRGPQAPLRVIYLGRLSAVKGIDVLAEIIAQADPRHFRFGVAGEGPERFRLEPVRGRFESHGLVQGKGEVARVLRGYDVMVLPSITEQFGIALIEAMACGVVCVASDGLVPKDLILDGRNGFIVKRAAAAFLAALERLRDERLLREFRDRAFARVEEFDLEAVGARWDAVLKEAGAAAG